MLPCSEDGSSFDGKRPRSASVVPEDSIFLDSYDFYGKCMSLHQMRDGVNLLAKDSDIFHTHNEPSWFVNLVKEVTDLPVILDVHDSYLARVSPEEADALEEKGEGFLRITVEERNNFQLADGLVFPSKPFADLIRREFKLTQPYIVLPSYVQRNLYSYNPKKWYGGLVYEGRVDLAEDVKKSSSKSGFQYTVYEDLAKQAHKIGMDFHIYARKDKAFKKVYEDIAYVHDPVGYGDLMNAIARHDWGWWGI